MAAEQAVSAGTSTRADEPRRARRWLSSGLGLLAAQILLGLALLAFWELASGTLIDSFFVSKPSAVLRELSTQRLGGMMAFFLTFFNTFAGVGGVDQGLKNVARVMGASPFQVLLKVVLPASTPWIVAGLRLGFPYALVAAVVGEMVMSTAGIGHRIISATQVFNVTGTMAGVLVLMVVVMLVNWALDRAEAHLLRWRPTGPETAGTQG
jgi:ABC-type nitrate/sulfonate/bicarbonate transport system permease component